MSPQATFLDIVRKLFRPLAHGAKAFSALSPSMIAHFYPTVLSRGSPVQPSRGSQWLCETASEQRLSAWGTRRIKTESCFRSVFIPQSPKTSCKNMPVQTCIPHAQWHRTVRRGCTHCKLQVQVCLASSCALY